MAMTLNIDQMEIYRRMIIITIKIFLKRKEDKTND